MHNIKERPVVEDGQIVARPMMYIALSYDHRIIDGKDAVLFLVAVKEALEDPARLLLNRGLSGPRSTIRRRVLLRRLTTGCFGLQRLECVRQEAGTTL